MPARKRKTAKRGRRGSARLKTLVKQRNKARQKLRAAERKLAKAKKEGSRKPAKRKTTRRKTGRRGRPRKA